MKTVLIVHSRPDIVSGAELAIADVVDRRSERLRYVMLTPGEGALAAWYHRKQYDVWPRTLPTRRRLFPGWHTLQSLLFARRFRRARVDAVLCNTFAAAARPATACRLARIPHAVYVREYMTKTRLHRAMLRRADLVLAVSADVARHVADMAVPSRIQVAYDHLNAAPLQERVAAHRHRGHRLLPFGAAHPVIGVIGRITRYKQPDLLLRAAPAVLRAVPAARFVVVGSASERERPFEDSLPVLAQALGIAGQVAFLGHRTDALELMSELAVCCVTSDREPFPRTLLEAQLAGCPVVAADTGGCPEMVQDGSTGLLFSAVAPDAAEQLAARIIRLLQQPALGAALTAAAQRRLADQFASLTPVRRFEDLLLGLAQDDPP